jgi:hypothetical protein
MRSTDQTKSSRQEKVKKKWQTTRSPQDKAIFNKATLELKLLLKDLKQQAIRSYLDSLTATEATEYSLWKATKRLNRPQTHIPHYELQRETERSDTQNYSPGRPLCIRLSTV